MSIPWGRALIRITHLSRKGQLTIPVAFIRQLRLRPGVTKIAITPIRDGIALIPTKQGGGDA